MESLLPPTPIKGIKKPNPSGSRIRGSDRLLQSSPSLRASHVHLSSKTVRFNYAYTDTVRLNRCLSNQYIPKKCCLRQVLCEKLSLSFVRLEVKEQWLPFCKSRKMVYFTPFASTDDGVAINGTTQASSYNDTEETRLKSSQSVQAENVSSGLVQSIHDVARGIELAIQEHSSSSKPSWFPEAWLGVDKNAWIKTLSYQAAVHSLIQAAIEISSRGDARDKHINLMVQRSLLRHCAPLESIIRDELSSKQPAADEWFWSHQHPMVVTTFVKFFERDPRFTAATALCWKGESSGSCTTNDTSLLMLALSCLATVKKLGSTKICCPPFFSMVPDIIGRLMDTLLDFVPIQEAYYCMKDIGLRREFLFHFGPRAATVEYKNDIGAEERAFWIDLIQNQLQRAIDREKIWSRLTTSESTEVLEKDLAIFGFFIALGRNTQSFLSSSDVSVTDNSIGGIIRYLIGGSVLYYPQLSAISSYQLFVEVVCEELEWLPFYQSNIPNMRQMAGKKSKQGLPSREAVSLVLDVCSYWMTGFIKYSAWLENPSNIKATRFLSRGHSKLTDCIEELGEPNTNGRVKYVVKEKNNHGSQTNVSIGSELDSFDKALESVEEALIRLEDLLQELHLSNSNPGKEHLKAACSDLERIRKLKKEAEFLEASFRAKAASLQQVDTDEPSASSASEQRQYSNQKTGKASNESKTNQSPLERMAIKPRGFWSFLVQNSTKLSEPGPSTLDQIVISDTVDNEDLELNEIRRFERLRQELIELEKRVRRTTDDSQNEKELELELEVKDKTASVTGNYMIVPAKKKDDVIAKSIKKIKETSKDVWQGTQLLVIDVAAAMVLIKRSLLGDELTEKEKKALRRTLTDLASVVPIGFLMLLPVTAVGHAAMLAAIQRYAPSLIPSTYGRERLDLLRQLEKVKEMEKTEMVFEETTEAVGSSNIRTD